MQPRTASFADWFASSMVVNDDGSARKVFRGEHGETDDGVVQSRLPSITFTECAAAASSYAMEPNDHRMRPQQPRVVCAYLRIANPILNQPDDPFAELGDVARHLGETFARTMAIRYAGHVENTSNWLEDVGIGYAGVEEFLVANPKGLSRLYMVAYPLLDDPEFVAQARAAGFDGAIHIGNGQTASLLEYRVFDHAQIRFAAYGPEPAKPDLRIHRALEARSLVAGELSPAAKRVPA